MRIAMLAAILLSCGLAQGGIIQDDSDHKYKLEKFLDERKLTPVVLNAVAYSGNVFLFFNRTMTNFSNNSSCDTQREFLWNLYTAWENTLKPRHIATGVIIRSYTGRDLMSIKRGMFGFKYHCD